MYDNDHARVMYCDSQWGWGWGGGVSSCMMSPVMYKISTSFLSLHCTKLRIRTDSLNANEIANGVLSCLVAITASCPYVTYWQACIIGSE